MSIACILTSRKALAAKEAASNMSIDGVCRALGREFDRWYPLSWGEIVSLSGVPATCHRVLVPMLDFRVSEAVTKRLGAHAQA